MLNSFNELKTVTILWSFAWSKPIFYFSLELNMSDILIRIKAHLL